MYSVYTRVCEGDTRFVSCRRKDRRKDLLAHFIAEREAHGTVPPTLVYALTTKLVDNLALLLASKGFKVGYESLVYGSQKSQSLTESLRLLILDCYPRFCSKAICALKVGLPPSMFCISAQSTSMNHADILNVGSTNLNC